MFRQGKVEYPMSSGWFPSGNKVITFVIVNPVLVFSITKVRIAYYLECFVIMANPGAEGLGQSGGLGGKIVSQSPEIRWSGSRGSRSG
jgi:hypothetical protein